MKRPPRLGIDEWAQRLSSLEWGRVDQLPAEPTYTRQNRGKRFGDLLWTTGRTKIASDRFVSVLREAGATGYSTFPVTVRGTAETATQRYRGLVVFGQAGDDCFALYPSEQHWTFGITGALLRDLHAAGVDDFEIIDDPRNTP